MFSATFPTAGWTHPLRALIRDHRSIIAFGTWMSALGQAAGFLLTPPHYGEALLPAFISAAVILNTAVMALPFEKDGRLPRLMSGALFMD